MIIYLPTKQTFTNQKEAKSYFGNHHYRRLVKKGDIYFTNYKHTVANDLIQKDNIISAVVSFTGILATILPFIS